MTFQTHFNNFEVIKQLSDLEQQKTFFILSDEQIKRYYELKMLLECS